MEQCAKELKIAYSYWDQFSQDHNQIAKQSKPKLKDLVSNDVKAAIEILKSNKLKDASLSLKN